MCQSEKIQFTTHSTFSPKLSHSSRAEITIAACVLCARIEIRKLRHPLTKLLINHFHASIDKSKFYIFSYTETYTNYAVRSVFVRCTCNVAYYVSSFIVINVITVHYHPFRCTKASHVFDFSCAILYIIPIFQLREIIYQCLRKWQSVLSHQPT